MSGRVYAIAQGELAQKSKTKGKKFIEELNEALKPEKIVKMKGSEKQKK